MKVFRYACLLRPPGPGAIPRQGLIECRCEEGTAPSGHHYWGTCDYNFKLPKIAVYHYDLELIGEYDDERKQ